MPVLPIPMIISLILGFLILHSLVRRETHPLFIALIAACALQGIIISLNQYYGLTAFRYIQPISAASIPPLAYIAFQATAVRSFDLTSDLVHIISPLFVGFCVLFTPLALDFAIPLIFIFYGALLLWQVRGGEEALPRTRLETGAMPVLIWRTLSCALFLSAFSDALIIVSQIMGMAALQPWIISVFSSLMLLALGMLSLSRALESGEEIEDTGLHEQEIDTSGDEALMQNIKDLIEEQKLYLNPNLTLNQIARKLGVPSKQISSTINRSTSDNVSRYINAFRIEHACKQLKAGENVTQAMLVSGFNTKSNFNREFLRQKKTNPKEWLAQHKHFA